MRAYLETLPQAPYTAARARCRVPVVIGALLPGMLRLAAASADGALTYFASPEHTRLARSIIGPDKKLCVTQALILEEDAAKAESAARAYVNHYLRLPNYQRQMKLVGFSEADFASGASDRLVRAIVAWGKAAQLQERIAAHYAAGATHVCILALRTGVSEKPGEWLPDKRCLEALAP
jgi:probable F420-dependent oxidoreductase